MGRRTKQQPPPEPPVEPIPGTEGEATEPPVAPPPRRRSRFARVRKQIEYEAPVETVVGGEPSNGANGEPVAEPTSEADDEFIRLLNSPRYRAVVERDDPAEWNGVKCEGEVKTFKLPKLWQDIVDFIAQNHGGRKYRIEIRNPRNGEVVAARQFEVDGEPILPGGFEETDDQRAERMFAEARRHEETDPIASLERQQAIAQRQVELERTEQMLEGLRDRRKAGQGGTAVDAKIAELERKVETGKLETRLAALEQENKILREQRQLQAQQPRGETSEVALILKQMQMDRQASDQRFNQLVQQLHNDKMDAMMQKLDEIQRHRAAAAPQNTLKEQIGMLKDLAETFGISLRGERDDEDDQPKEWYEILVKEHVPRILDLIESRKKEGKPGMTKEEFAVEMQKAAKAAEDEAVARAQARIALLQQQQQATAAALPAGAAPAPSPTTGQPAPTPPPQPQSPIPSVEDEKKLRIGAIVAGFDRELEFRPRSFERNYAAWQAAPEDILEKMCKAADPVAMLAAFEGIVIPEKLEGLKTKLGTNERALAWAARGLNELKEWWSKSLTDPKFDPADEDEEDEPE